MSLRLPDEIPQGTYVAQIHLSSGASEHAQTNNEHIRTLSGESSVVEVNGVTVNPQSVKWEEVQE